MGNTRSVLHECLSCGKKFFIPRKELIRAKRSQCRYCGSTALLESFEGGDKLLDADDSKRIRDQMIEDQNG